MRKQSSVLWRSRVVFLASLVMLGVLAVAWPAGVPALASPDQAESGGDDVDDALDAGELRPVTIANFDESIEGAQGVEIIDVTAHDPITAGDTDALAQVAPGASRDAAGDIEGAAVPFTPSVNGQARPRIDLDLPAPDGERTPTGRFFALRLRLLLAGGDADAGATIRLYFLCHDDEANRRPTGFYRRVDVSTEAAHGGEWLTLTLPLAAWRWRAGTVGDWTRVDELVVLLPPTFTVVLDDCTLIPPENIDDATVMRDGDYATIGYVPLICNAADTVYVQDRLFRSVRMPDGDRGYFALEPALGFGSLSAPDNDDSDDDADGTTAPRTALRRFRLYVEVDGETFPDADVSRLVDRLDRVGAFIERVFEVGGKVTPPLPDTPPVVLLYADLDGMVTFFERLSDHWNVDVEAPQSDGYTVQAYAGCSWRQEYGWERPSIFHEAIHAALPLWTGLAVETSRWLHEALCNYLQMCVYPASLSRDTYVRSFAGRITQDSFFRPLREITRESVPTRHYAQLASLAAYFVLERPQWLPGLTNALVAGDTLEDFLATRGLGYADLQDQWLDWGRERFAESIPDADDGTPAPVFDLPPEWQD